MLRRPLLALALTAATACGADDRDATVRSVFARSDESLARARPALLAARYARMATSPVQFYRGSIALFLRDWRDGAMEISHSRFAVDSPLPIGVGDPHVENFGTLLGRDGRLTFEPNDLDGADRVPYLWDLRRLTVGLVIAARASNSDSPSAQRQASDASRDIAREAARAYADALASHPSLTADAAPTADVIVADLFRRGARDAAARAELDGLTDTTESARTLRRGVLDEEDPTQFTRELPEWARPSLQELLVRYRASLTSPPDARFFTVLDAVREFGSGVASLPRVRVLALVRGPTDAPSDDVILEVKEQADAITPGALPPYVFFDDVPSRVAAARAALWTRPDADPLWGTSTWLGMPVQIRTETEAAKTLRVSRMTASLGTPDALRALARTLGARLAMIHRSSLTWPIAQATLIARDPAGFAVEQADVSVRYAAIVFDDFARFQRLLRDAGPTLGVTPDDTDRPSSPVQQLFDPAR